MEGEKVSGKKFKLRNLRLKMKLQDLRFRVRVKEFISRYERFMLRLNTQRLCVTLIKARLTFTEMAEAMILVANDGFKKLRDEFDNSTKSR